MKNTKIKVLIFTMVSVLISCQKTDLDATEPLDTQEVSEDVAKITLDNGNSIYFQEINDEHLTGTFIMEESDCESCGTLNALTQEFGGDLSEREIFWALSEPGAAIPNFLDTPTKQKSTESRFSEPQGWARTTTQRTISPIFVAQPTVACNNNNFTSSIAGGFLGAPDFIRLDKTPGNYNAFKNDCSNVPASYCENGTRYRYIAQYSNIKKWRGKICSKAVQSRSNNHYLPIGGFCANPPCDSYKGPELYFEYKSNGVWKSMKNNRSGILSGFEVPANKTKVYTYAWNTSQKTSFRLRVKNAMAKDQFDFMMDKAPQNGGGGNNDGTIQLEDLPKVPSYINLQSGYGNHRMMVDFTNSIDGKPQITIPRLYLPVMPQVGETVIFPNNFCGFKIRKGSRFIWLDQQNNALGVDNLDNVFNYVPEDESILSLFGNEAYLGGIQFTGPIGACDKPQVYWKFPFPFTKNGLQSIDSPVKLVIEFEQGSEVEFLNTALYDNSGLNAKEMFKDIDFNKIIAYYNKLFNPSGFEEWVNKVCEENPADCPLQDD
ncbi:hypothetical protein ABW636_12600 [Aquimarina sp. 2201CG1-2-11]|uniref:hypothetical protein n=1 Tax=Aquimarina discodermiae TaxID=3231043 RepID=UPI00346289C7